MAQRQYPHRALILQGGGALGAYEAAIYGKAFDFSYSTIHDLFQKGYEQGKDAYIRTIWNERTRTESSREKL